MKLDLACADFTFPLLTHDRALDLIAMLGFAGVDLGLFEQRSHLQPSRVFRAPAKSGEQIRRKLADRGLRCADVFLIMDPDFVPFAINHPLAARRRKARAWFLQTLEYAVAAGARHVTTLPGVSFPEEQPVDSWQRARDELAWRVDQARRHRLILGVEAHVGSLVPHPRSALRLVRGVPGLTLTLDYTHFIRAGIAQKTIEPLVAHASHFHVRGACRGRLQTSFARNAIDYARVLRAMRRTGYRGYVGIEYVWIEWERLNEADNLSETILFRDFLRQKMALLR